MRRIATGLLRVCATARPGALPLIHRQGAILAYLSALSVNKGAHFAYIPRDLARMTRTACID
jgi:hypothetical protein